jgi:TPR repeat protein
MRLHPDYQLNPNYFLANRKAADQGYAPAQDNLGAMYQHGRFVPQDYEAAVTWYRKAADQGYAPAQNNLGVMYGLGDGVPQDSVSALVWFKLAARDGDTDAIRNLDIVTAGMAPAQIEEAEKRFTEWRPKPPASSRQ